MPTRPAFPDPPSRPGMVGLGLVIPLPQAANYSTPGDKPLPALLVQTHNNKEGIDIPLPEELAQSLQAKASVLTPHSGYIKILKETTSCKIPSSPLPHTSFQSTHVSQETASSRAPRPALSVNRPKLMRSVALLPNVICSSPGRGSLQKAVPVSPFPTRSKARGLSRSQKRRVFVSSSRTARRCSRHMQSFEGTVSSASSRRNSGSSMDPSNPLSVSTSYISRAGPTSLPIAPSKLVRRPRVSPAGSTRPTPTSSVEAISVASWLELDSSMSLPEDIVCSSPEPIDPTFSTITEGDWEDEVSQASLPTHLTFEGNGSSGLGRGLFRHGAIVRFTRTLKRARRAKASRMSGNRKESATEDGDSGIVRWSPQVSLLPHLAQILSTPRPAMVRFESRDTTLTPVAQTDQLDPDVRNVLSGLWSTRLEDSPWATSGAMVSRTGSSSAIPGESMVVGRPGNDKGLSQMAMSDYGRAQDDEEDVLQLYEDMSSCPSDSRSSGICSSAASSRLGSTSSSESMW